MFIDNTFIKKSLEKFINEIFHNFGEFSSCFLLDSLKMLGFHYATNAGISINIEDLKTPIEKEKFLLKIEKDIEEVSRYWQEGLVSDVERFQRILDNWTLITEKLKDQIILYYKKFDPFNNLYIMTFSGARGNISQVRQLIGIRGLMADQSGNIIDLPIQNNFREGLTSTDYMVSAYGARKGTVDTALKTAESGYLTRRLIYLSQDLIISEKDCETKEGLIIFLNKNNKDSNLLGRVLISYKKSLSNELVYCNKIISKVLLKKLTKEEISILKIRSSLTCKSLGRVCQKCYGWKLSENKFISFGEAVGITAAQSIGEPGTQLTMRTFHTGGVFTGEIVTQFVAPFSGQLIFPKKFKKNKFRTNHGINVLKIEDKTFILLLDWQGLIKKIYLPKNSFLYLTSSCFVKKDQLLVEMSKNSSVNGNKKLKPLYSFFDSQIKFESFHFYSIKETEKSFIGNALKELKILQKNAVLWLTSGKLCSIPTEIYLGSEKFLKKNKAFAQLKIITPFTAYTNIKKNTISIYIYSKHLNIDIPFSSLFHSYSYQKHFILNIFPLIKHNQFLDSHSILVSIYLFPVYNEKIYAIRKNKEGNQIFFITESDIWKVNSDEINEFLLNKNLFNKTGIDITSSYRSISSGFLLKKDGFRMTFQKAFPIFLNQNTFLKCVPVSGDFLFVHKNQLLANLLSYKQATEDIIQGLPKVDKIIEAEQSKNKAYLNSYPGIVEKIITNKVNKFLRPTVRTIAQKICAIAENPKVSAKALKAYNLTMFPTSATCNLFTNKIRFLNHENTNPQLVKILNPVSWTHTTILSKYDKSLWNVTQQLPSIQYQYTKSDFYTLRTNYNIPHKWSLKRFKKEIYNKIYKLKQHPRYLNFRSNRKEIYWYHENNFIYDFMSKKPFITANNKNLIINSMLIARANNQSPQELIIEITNKETSNSLNLDTLDGDISKKNLNGFFLLEEKLNNLTHVITKDSQIIVKLGDFLDLGEPITDGINDPSDLLLLILFSYHTNREGIFLGNLKSIQKFRLILINSIQAIYYSQGVVINSKHLEIIVHKLTSYIKIQYAGFFYGTYSIYSEKTINKSPFFKGELIRFSLMTEFLNMYNNYDINKRDIYPRYTPIFLAATKVSLIKEGFLSSTAFQESKRILSLTALEGTSDWFSNMKESIIAGKKIPIGSSFFTSKFNLDNIFYYAKFNKKSAIN